MKNSSSVFLIVLVVFFTSCSVFGTDDKKAQAQFSVDSALLNQQSFHLKVEYGDQTKVFINSNFKSRENPTNGIATPIFETPTSGILKVEFELRKSDEDQLLATGSFQLKLKEDWRYSAHFFSDSVEADPTYGCFGCIESYSYFIDGSKLDSTSSIRNDSLYVVTGGNSISNPVIY